VYVVRVFMLPQTRATSEAETKMREKIGGVGKRHFDSTSQAFQRFTNPDFRRSTMCLDMRWPSERLRSEMSRLLKRALLRYPGRMEMNYGEFPIELRNFSRHLHSD
jgi:hypothetical protein